MRTLLAPVAALLAVSAPSQVIYVHSGAPGGGNGASWAAAYNNLQTALNSAGAGASVWVSTGIYGGSFSVPAGVTVLGGLVADAPGKIGSVRASQSSYINRTVLQNTSGSRVVTLGQGSVLDGFTVQFGLAGSPGGGGALIDGVSAKIRNCYFAFNSNIGGDGAAVLVRNGANARIENSIFFANGDPASGAAIDVDGATGTFVNLTLDQNDATGIRLRNGAAPSLYNCIFSNNGITTASAFGIDQVDTSVNPVVQHCLFHANQSGEYRRGGTVLTTAAQINALSGAGGNLVANPLYGGISDWHLQLASPALDAGHPSVFPERTQGFYDSSRRLDGNGDGSARNDIGADEFTHVVLNLPVDQHRHVHAAVTGTPGLPVWLLLSGAEIPGGFFVNPFGYLFASPVGAIVTPYGTIPTTNTPPITYPPGLPAGVPTFWQAITVAGTAIHVSNPAVHVTNT